MPSVLWDPDAVSGSLQKSCTDCTCVVSASSRWTSSSYQACASSPRGCSPSKTIITELSESPSSNSSPTFFIEIIDGASSGLIDTACISPTVSSCGTVTLTTTMSAIQPSRIGTANARIIRGMNGRFCG